MSWFPEKGSFTALAKAVCQRCPVVDECLEYALSRMWFPLPASGQQIVLELESHPLVAVVGLDIDRFNGLLERIEPLLDTVTNNA